MECNRPLLCSALYFFPFLCFLFRSSYFHLDHLSSCTGTICHDFRDHFAHAIMGLMSASSDGGKWVRRHHHLPLSQLLHKLFPSPPSNIGCSVRWQRHLTYAMCGAFSTSDASFAIKTLAFHDKQQGQTIMQRHRLLCVDRIAAFYLPYPQATTTIPTPPILSFRFHVITHILPRLILF